MSTKATTINRTASTQAAQSAQQNRLARAEQAAERAEQAALDAAKAAEAARAAADAGDVEAAAKAAKSARSAANGAESALIIAEHLSSKGRSSRTTSEGTIAHAVDRSARYLVIYNGQLIASFLREDDALLFEAELADLDRAHGVESARCEVRSWSGKRLGGYLLTAGKLLSFVRDHDFNRRFGGVRRS